MIAGEVIMPLYECGPELRAEGRSDAGDCCRSRRRGGYSGASSSANARTRHPWGGVRRNGRGRPPSLDPRPIDGTKSFIHHVPLFGTLMALERDGVPVVGVIACHAAGETASAATGTGAWLNGAKYTFPADVARRCDRLDHELSAAYRHPPDGPRAADRQRWSAACVGRLLRLPDGGGGPG